MFDCGVREKTVLEELESLDLDQHDRDRIVKKYRDEEARRKEEVYREMLGAAYRNMVKKL